MHRGAQGAAGAQGAQGAQGSQGAQGAQGAQGVQDARRGLRPRIYIFTTPLLFFNPYLVLLMSG